MIGSYDFEGLDDHGRVGRFKLLARSLSADRYTITAFGIRTFNTEPGSTIGVLQSLPVIAGGRMCP